MSAATTSTLFIATTKVAAFGRHHKRGAAAFGRGTSFVVSFVIAALNRVNIVEDTAILVFHVRVIVFHVRRHSRFMIPRRSYHARLRADKDRHDTIPRIKVVFGKFEIFKGAGKYHWNP